MAVPFVGKDKPSQAVEFASPDVMIGLPCLAYHYEGLRRFNYFILAKVFKEELKNEMGPFTTRVHRVLFQSWVDAGRIQKKRIEVLPLELFQPGDEHQLKNLAELLSSSQGAKAHYLENLGQPTTSPAARARKFRTSVAPAPR